MAARKGGAARTTGVRLLIAAGVIGVGWFAVQGGEYGTVDLVSLRSRRAKLERDVAAQQRAVDSLVKWKKAIETDPAIQERIAREEFGMVRGSKELLYRFIDVPDSVRK